MVRRKYLIHCRLWYQGDFYDFFKCYCSTLKPQRLNMNQIIYSKDPKANTVAFCLEIDGGWQLTGWLKRLIFWLMYCEKQSWRCGIADLDSLLFTTRGKWGRYCGTTQTHDSGGSKSSQLAPHAKNTCSDKTGGGIRFSSSLRPSRHPTITCESD